MHFGFLDPSGRGERPFGSFGLAIDRPQTQLSLRRGSEFEVSGVDCVRAEPYLRSIAASFGLTGSYHLHLDEAIPAHAGLGSGTQLALAIGSAVAVLEGLPLDLDAIAARLDRGKRSGIGIGTFGQGGAVLDGGPGPGTLPPVLARVPFPRDWRVLLIFDPAEIGVHGADETGAFSALPDFPESETADLTRRVLLGALPALAEEDFKSFCDQVGYLQRKMGAYFAPIQGGAYVSAGVAAVLKGLAVEGVTGLGQSSWGPTGFAFAPSEAEGQELLAAARATAGSGKLRLELARGRNEPAVIETR
ncbi:GHMP kinase [Methyloceanibacter sp.]|uniref:GHMP family kinase ATP-binding protein n=1 Tax=Methyloceanibacter sp. TaxID=1965321 RepID=UPI003D6D8713